MFNKTLKHFLAETQADTLVITHNLGGGSEQYIKNNFYKNKCLILRNVNPGRYFSFSLIEDVKRGENAFMKKKDLETLFQKPFKKIIINSVVGFYNMFDILNLCIDVKKKNPNTSILYPIHDYNCICPTNNLVSNGFFCRLDCTTCKRKISPSIIIWRKKWLKFLSNTDEIRCFSYSSQKILLATYPTLTNQIRVVPHDMSYSTFTPINISENSHPVIGIVGACITEFKGRVVMQRILREIPEQIRFVFVGTKQSQIKTNRKNVCFLGTYKHNELQKIIEGEKITHVIFPSVCPETFSYVVSEIIQMDLPIICFNIGAQAEKVSLYGKGVVCETIEDMINNILILQQN